MPRRDFNSTLKLSESNTLRLIQLYRGEPCLYDIHSELYKNRDMRAAAIKRIAATLSIDGFGPKEVATKFKNLRNSYSQELRKLNDSEKSGDVYVPKVYWFEMMDSFLRPQMYFRLIKNSAMYQEITQNKRNDESSENFVEELDENEEDQQSFIKQEPIYEEPSIVYIDDDDDEEISSFTSQRQEDRNLIQEEAESGLSHRSSYSIDQQVISDNITENRYWKTLRQPFLDEADETDNKRSKYLKRAISPEQPLEKPSMLETVENLNEFSQMAAVTVKNRDMYDHFGEFVAGVLRKVGDQRAIFMTNEITTILAKHMTSAPSNTSVFLSSTSFSNANKFL